MSESNLKLESVVPDVLEKLGGGMMNLILGALIVWVGQTTYQHAGVLAGLDDKFVHIEDNFTTVDKRNDSLRKWLESVVSDLKDSNRSQFTAKEGDKVVAQIRKSDEAAIELERRVTERLSQLEVKIVAMQAGCQSSGQVAALEAELAQLRFAVAQTSTSQQHAMPHFQYDSASNTSQRPIYLPPTTNRR